MEIHCKVRYGEEYRRFVVKDKNFSNLYETVKRLFSLPDGCVLKYKDDEEDFVTMSSDEELNSALEFSSGLLKLFVANPNQPLEMEFSGRNGRGKFHRHMGNHGNHGNFGHHGHHGHPGHPHPPFHHGRPGWENKGCKNKREKKWEKKLEKKMEKKMSKKNCRGVRNPEMLQKRIAWLTKKREEFEKRSKELGNFAVDGVLPPNLVQEQQFIERKLSGISARLEKLSLLSSEASNSQSGDSETLPDIPTAKVELSESEKTVRLAELKELREVLLKSCFITTQEAKFKMKFAKSVLENFSGDPQSEEGKRLVQEFEEARVNCQENKKVFKSLVSRDRELCDLLGMDKKELFIVKKKSF